MLELIEFIKCRITIFANILPMYQVLLIIYLSAPAIIITYYQNKHPQFQPIIFAIILLLVWLFQMALWYKGYNIYYKS